MVSASFLLVPACPSVLAWLLPCDSPPATGWAHVLGSCGTVAAVAMGGLHRQVVRRGEVFWAENRFGEPSAPGRQESPVLAAVLSTVCLALQARSSSRVVGWSLRQVELWYIQGCTCVGSHSGSGDG